MKFKKTWFGITFLAVLLLASFLYPIIGPEDYSREFLKYDENGKFMGLEFSYDENGRFRGIPPYPPSLEHVLGTDRNGGDILMMLLAGAKVTILVSFIVTIIRVLAGGAIAIVMSLWFPKTLPYWKDLFFLYRYVPVFILVFFLMASVSLEYTGIPVNLIISYQVLILSVVGIPSVFLTSSEIIGELKGKSFIQASYLMGASHGHVFKKQLWPYIKSYGLLVFVQQFMSVMVIIMHLGVFKFFIGGPSESGEFLTEGDIKVSLTMEWSGLIGQNFQDFHMAPWVVIAPLLAFLIIHTVMNSMKKELEGHLDGNLVSVVKRGGKEKGKEKNFRSPLDSNLFGFKKQDIKHKT